MAKRKKKKTKERKTPYNKITSKVVRCYMCNKIVNAGKELAEHVINCHNLSLVKYTRICPKRAPFDVSRTVILADDLYQAQVRKALTGKWPEWYDPDAPVVFEGATALCDLLLSGHAAHKLERSVNMRFACILYAQSLLDPTKIIEAAQDPIIRQQINEAMNLLDRLEGTLHRDLIEVLSEIKFRTDISTIASGGGARARFVAAEVTQLGGRLDPAQAMTPERQKDIVAQVQEFAAQMQGAGFGEDYHLVEPPSQAEKRDKKA